MSDPAETAQGAAQEATDDGPRVAYLPETVTKPLKPDDPRRTHPLSFLLRAITGLRSAILPVAAVFYSMSDKANVVPIALGIGLLIIALNGGVAYLSWRKLTYRLGDTDIRVESGILSRAARSVPYERIQDVSLEQTLLPRLFGLVEVRFETGAGGSDELKLSYLSEEEGERLREVVRERRDEEAEATTIGADGEAAEVAPEIEGPPIFVMGPRRILTLGLFEFSLAVFAVLAGTAQQFDFLLPLDEWRQAVGGQEEYISGLGPLAQLTGFLFALVGLIALGIFTGLVRTTLREWGFTLDRTAKGFRRRRGLLTRTDVVMPAHRVQALTIGTGIIRNRFGWNSLKFVSLAKDSGSASHVVAPFAKMDEIGPIARESGFALPGEDVRWFAADRKYRIDRALIWSVFFVLIAVGLLFSPEPHVAFIPLALIPLVMLTQWMRWKFTRYAADGTQLYTREKWLAPHRKIANRVKLHSAEISQGPIAQRRGYATLHLGLAGGNLSMPGLPEQQAHALREAVMESIVSTDFSQLETARPAVS